MLHLLIDSGSRRDRRVATPVRTGPPVPVRKGL
jgi:hypothetical protein